MFSRRLPFQFRILAKKELWPIAFIGWYLDRSGQIPIDTRNPHATLSSLGAGVKALRAGMPLFVFPEGGRTPNGELQNFLSGAAYLAIRAQVPLVPIALSGVYDLLPIHTRHLYSGKLTLMAGEPIETTGMTIRQTDELTERVRSAILELSGQAEGAAGRGGDFAGLSFEGLGAGDVLRLQDFGLHWFLYVCACGDSRAFKSGF